MESQTKNLIKYLITPLLIAALLLGLQYKKEQRDWLLHVKFYDIGQGDSFLITTYQGNQILVDGGPGDSVLQKLAQDIGVYDKTIEMMVLTHAHLDHFEGLIAVLNKYQVEKILLPGTDVKNPAYTAFLKAVENEQSEIIYAVQGQRIYLDDATVLDIMHPTSKEIRLEKNDDINDTSIVAMLRFGKTNFLLTGDAGINIEDELLENFNLDADVIKIGHHGSKHSTSESLLKEVTPAYSIIQVGNNKYGHPTPEILRRLEENRVRNFRSDYDKDVEFVSNGVHVYKK